MRDAQRQHGMQWVWRHRWWLLGGVLAAALAGGWLGRRLMNERRLDRVVAAAAARYQVDPALIKAVIWRESRFHPHARGSKGEVGLMQLREEAGRDWARAERLEGYDHAQMMHPTRNVMAGTWYLRKQLARYAHTDNPVPYALAAYNAGPSNVARWATGEAATNSARFIRQIGFPSTQRYVQTVMRRRDRYWFGISRFGFTGASS
ncbi:MAG: lytic transglycosylase domain-containing protein [Verrucomicrobia bacterium]|nr:lytic transglycosylase domain-containing protein [Verrucomicrobiota bacterium]